MTDAVADASALRGSELSPQEMAFTYEAIRALLALHDGPPQARMEAVLDEALATVVRMIRQPNNEGLAAWCHDGIAGIRTETDIAAFLAHMQAVLRLYALMAYLPPPGADSSPDLPAGASA